jgi:hypothetical protein
MTDESLDAITPYGGFIQGNGTCGGGLDLGVGSVVYMKDMGKRASSSPSACRCHFDKAYATVDGVEEIAHAEPVGLGLGEWWFGDKQSVAIGSCEGTYTINIQPVDAEFFAHSPDWVATDYMLVRWFTPSARSSCGGVGSAVPGGCWDSWAVRIRDSSGKLVTKDTPIRSGSASGADAGLDEDAGNP